MTVGAAWRRPSPLAALRTPLPATARQVLGPAGGLAAAPPHRAAGNESRRRGAMTP